MLYLLEIALLAGLAFVTWRVLRRSFVRTALRSPASGGVILDNAHSLRGRGRFCQQGHQNEHQGG